MNDQSTLYFECHVTLPGAVHDEKLFGEICARFGFKPATFTMVKDGPVPDAFTSARDKSYAKLVQRMTDLIRALQLNGFFVSRYKIEDTLLDTKYQVDPLNLFSPKLA